MNLLLVDDEIEQKESWEETLNTIEKGNKEKYSINLSFSKDLETAKDLIANNNIDFLIVDLRLGKSDPEGNSLINMVYELSLRIPTIVVTGTPEDVLDDTKIIKKFKKGEASISEIINYLISIYNTGITKILGRTGIIEDYLFEVFNKNLLPSINKWVEYAEQSAEKTEKALLRYSLNHLYQYLDDSEEYCFAEEMYIYPPKGSNYYTGSIVEEKENCNKKFIIIAPACDIALHNGSFKTERVQLLEIQNAEDIEKIFLRKVESQDEKKVIRGDLYKNNKTLFYHWLPNTDFFAGGFINFRRISSYSRKDLEKNFSAPVIQISPFFCKDIVSRFSSYYARQGQPNIDLTSFLMANEDSD